MQHGLCGPAVGEKIALQQGAVPQPGTASVPRSRDWTVEGAWVRWHHRNALAAAMAAEGVCRQDDPAYGKRGRRRSDLAADGEERQPQHATVPVPRQGAGWKCLPHPAGGGGGQALAGRWVGLEPWQSSGRRAVARPGVSMLQGRNTTSSSVMGGSADMLTYSCWWGERECSMRGNESKKSQTEMDSHPRRGAMGHEAVRKETRQGRLAGLGPRTWGWGRVWGRCLQIWSPALKPWVQVAIR